jgi:cytoskeletal protein RodZ
MSENLQTLGQAFSQRRNELKLSLKEAESATSIRRAYLEAIEAGEMDKLISPVYAQGFVRQYAAFLGLDGDRVVTENPEVFRRPISQDFAYGIGTLEPRGNHGGGVSWLPNLLWIVAFGVLLLVTYFVGKSLELL